MKAYREVMVTGAGVLCAGATSPSELWELAQSARSSLSILASEATGSAPLAVARIDSPVPIPRRIRRANRLDRCALLALSAATSAWESARLTPKDASGAGVIVGTSRGPAERLWQTFGESKSRPLPSLAADSTAACLSGVVSSALELTGPCFTVSTACSAGAHAIALAADRIRSGGSDIVLAGGGDAPLVPPLLRQYLSTGILDTDLPPQRVCKPFDREANGTLLGEGAAFLVLESKEHAIARNAPVLAHLTGWAIGADGAIRSAEFSGYDALRRVSQAALAMAGVSFSELGGIHLHGTGTLSNDRMEAEWLAEVFSQNASPVPFTSTKAVTGHCLGASPALETVLCLEALRTGKIPPATNCHQPADFVPPGIVLGSPAPARHPRILKTSVGFWGTGAALLLEKTSPAQI